MAKERLAGMATPRASIRVPDADWKRWAVVAGELGVTRSELVRASVDHVVRAQQSANNVASDLFELLGNAPQGSGRKGQKSGEAKEAASAKTGKGRG